MLFGSVEEVPTVMLKLPSDWEYSTTFNSNSSSASSDIYYGHFGNREMKVIVGRLTPGDNRYSYWGSNTNNNLPKTENSKILKIKLIKLKIIQQSVKIHLIIYLSVMIPIGLKKF